MEIGIVTLIWNGVVNFAVCGLGLTFVAKKMRENGKKRRDFDAR